MSNIPDIIRSIILIKKVNGVKIASALRSLAPSFGKYEQQLISDVNGKRTYDIGILKDNKYPQTGYIIGSWLENGTIVPGITFTTKYPSGHKIVVANHRWGATHYDLYDEKKVIEAVESLKKGLEIRLFRK